MKSYQVSAVDDLPKVAQGLLEALQGRTVVLFRGGMGAGKTTLIRAICHLLGVEDEVTSPTFALVNEYLDAEGSPIYHFDFYRIDSPEEALDFGYEEYLYSGHLCLMEWPEKIEALLPQEALTVQIEILLESNSRQITLI